MREKYLYKFRLQKIDGYVPFQMDYQRDFTKIYPKCHDK